MYVRTIWKVSFLGLILTAGCAAGTAPGDPPAAPEDDVDAASAVTAREQPVMSAFGDSLPGLDADETARFEEGKTEFAQEEGVSDGLGPVFNDTACAKCHSVPATGGGSATLETRFGTVTNGHFDPLTNLGGSLIQVKGIGQAADCNFVGEVVPPEATLVSQRRATPLFGLGLVDAVPESTFHYVASFESRYFPKEAGRAGIVHDIAHDRNAVGRFGWKGQVPTLHQFSGDAYLNEMGVTNPEFPDENCPQGDCSLLRCNPRPDLNDDGTGVSQFTDFMTFLAPPPRGKFTKATFDGVQIFRTIGCSHCHWSTFRTGSAGSPALSFVRFHPYSDFMLHDMGSLGDGIELGDAKGGEFRTAPLWGVRVLTSFLHDGRASTLTDAILAHDGQARRARDRFAALSAGDQAALIGFLNSL